MLTFVVGMPSMVRTRFATPTIGREWMIGELGDVVEAVDPDGVVSVGSADVAGAHQPGDAGAAGRPVRVVAIDGVTLEVEPLEGAARDYREMRKKSGTPPRSTPPDLTPPVRAQRGGHGRSDVGEAGAGDAQVVAAAGDAAGVELGHQRQGELAARARRIAELGHGEAVR